mmetsp:Transcript_25354/g.51696  ORF Transcript_25354/g.51696 Transcript_25354/m.51696 type:complete len:98 (-) Transcript_25354:380-673(-)
MRRPGLIVVTNEGSKLQPGSNSWHNVQGIKVDDVARMTSPSCGRRKEGGTQQRAGRVLYEGRDNDKGGRHNGPAAKKIQGDDGSRQNEKLFISWSMN